MGSLAKLFISSWKNRSELNAESFDEDERAFMPAALALQSKPPEPLPRILSYIILAIFIFVLTWSCLAKIDIVSTAEGKIIPSGRVKVIQPLEKSVVNAILVKDGDPVKKGDPLIILDQTQTLASSQRLIAELNDSSDKAFSRRAFLRWLEVSEVGDGDSVRKDIWDNLSYEMSMSTSSDTYFQWYLQRCDQYIAERKSLEQRYNEVIAEKEVSEKVIKKLTRTLPLLTEHAESLDEMQSEKVVSRVQFLQVERERIQQEEDVATEIAKRKVFEVRMAEINSQINLHNATTRAQTLDELTALSREIESLGQESKKADDLNLRQFLRAPVDGRVQQLSVATVGGIVTPAQELMSIVPENDQREVEVMLENKDVGFVYEGQTAEIKVHTFPFTKYGVIDAEVIHISDDAVADENKGLIFPMTLAMNTNSINVNGREMDLKPGMSVTAEVKTGKRRLIEFFLAPVLKSRAESARER